VNVENLFFEHEFFFKKTNLTISILKNMLLNTNTKTISNNDKETINYYDDESNLNSIVLNSIEIIDNDEDELDQILQFISNNNNNINNNNNKNDEQKHVKNKLLIVTSDHSQQQQQNQNQNMECQIASSYFFPVSQFVASHFGVVDSGVSVLEEVF
jgi:hypothetical protein